MGKRKPLTAEEIERATAMRERGDKVSAIARALKVSAGALRWRFLADGVEAPKLTRLRPEEYIHRRRYRRGMFDVRAFTPQEDAQLQTLALAHPGKYALIGRELGRRSNSIRGRLMTLARYEERGLR